jgi:hypothetical protein
MMTRFKVLLLLLVTLPAVVEAQFNYTTNNGTITITITGYTGPGGVVTIPSTINGLPVTSIGDLTFAFCFGLTSASIPSSVTSLGDAAFYSCSSLTTITIPNSVTNIGDLAFANCTSLIGVSIPNSVSNIGEGTFDNCTSLTSVIIPDSVTSIGGGAFYFCTNLNSVTLGNRVASLGDYAFYGCASLTGVCFRGNAPSLGSSVFSGDSNATVCYLPGTTGWGPTFGGLPAVLWNPPVPYNYTTNNGTITITGYSGPGGVVIIPSAINFLPVTSIGDRALMGCISLTNLTIPDSVTNIGDLAFDYCPNLTSITIGKNVTSLGNLAFDGCINLTSVTIPNSVASIGFEALADCISLTAITVGALNSVYSSVDGVVFNKSQTTLVQCPGGKAGSYTISNSVTTIRDGAFSGCRGLTNVTIPDSVTSIGNDAFIGATRLASVTIGNSVTNIGLEAFRYCSLTNVTIPDSVTSIGVSAFMYCPYLTSVTIGKSVSSIGGFAFYGSGLTSVTIPDRVTSIGNNAFAWCDSLTNVAIPGSVTNIGQQAFSDCFILTGVYFHGNAPIADSSVFSVDNSYPPVYSTDPNATVYYLPGTTGWGSRFGGRPTALWFLPNPLILNSGPGFGVQTNRFGFIISWATNIPVVVEACTNLANPAWYPLQTNTLTGGSSYFGDPQWTNHPARLYRLRSP